MSTGTNVQDAMEDVEKGGPMDDAASYSAPRGLQRAIGWALFFAIGTAPWLLVNGIFVELPIFVNVLPEGEGVAAIIGALVQAGNIGLLYIPLRYTCGFNLSVTVCAVLALCCGSSVLAALLSTETIDGHSIPLFAITFFAGLGGCVSKVTWFPFAGNYRADAITAMSSGMGLSGLLVVLLGALQRVGNVEWGGGSGSNDNNKTLGDDDDVLLFSEQTFFGTIAVLLGVSAAAYGYVLFNRSFGTAWGTHIDNLSPSAEHDSPIQNAAPLHDGHSNVSFAASDTTDLLQNLTDSFHNSLVTSRRLSWRTLLLHEGTYEISFACVNSFVNYMIFPGALPYLQASSGRIFWATTVYYTANLVGRYFPFFAETNKLSGPILVNVAIGAYLLYVATLGGMAPDYIESNVWWASVAVPMGVFSFVNGFCSTMLPQMIKRREEMGGGEGEGEGDGDGDGAAETTALVQKEVPTGIRGWLIRSKGKLNRDQREALLQILGIANQVCFFFFVSRTAEYCAINE